MIITYCSSINDMIAVIDHKRVMQINRRPFLNFSSHESRCKKKLAVVERLFWQLRTCVNACFRCTEVDIVERFK